MKVFIAVILLFLPSAALAKTPILKPLADTYPVERDEFASSLVIDATTGKELYIYQPDKAWPLASITKLLSALVVIDRKPSWNRVVSLLAKDEVGGGRLRVAVGSKLSVKDLLYSSIVGSANNAAMAFARTSNLPAKRFIAAMNRKAQSLKMTGSSFVDPTGMSPENVSNARDIAKLATAAFADPKIHAAATTPSYSFRIRNRNVQKVIVNTDKLLTDHDDVYVHGGKTGYLEEARNNLVVKLERQPRDPEHPPLLVVVLGAPDRTKLFTSAKGLAEWAWNAYEW